LNGFDFWFYATKGVNDYTTSKELFSIKRHPDWLRLITIYNNNIKCRDTLTIRFDNTLNEDGILGKWNHVSCTGNDSLDIERIIFTNEEYGITSHGIMLIRQFRLWKDISKLTNEKKYTAFLSKINQEYIYFSIDSNKNIFLGYKSQEISITEQYTQLTNEINYGYSPIEDNIPELELCSETEVCQNVIKLNAIKDLEFKKITPSGTGRYTMEFWINIEIVSQLTLGIHFIWEKHLSITLIADNTQTSVLNVICFPQAYLDNVDGLESLEIYDLLEKSHNSQKLGLVDVSNKWIFVRCAVDLTRKIFYINDPDDNDTLTTHNYQMLKNLKL
jgi:hypothetical protein